MNKAKNIIGLIAALFAVVQTAGAYSIDGSISDWGVDLQMGLDGSEDAWAPSSATADWKVEDNIDDDCEPYAWEYGDCKDWTGYSAKGVHIQGVGQSHSDFDEPGTPQGGQVYDGPAGGEVYDIEALYFDDSAGYVYFAIVTSMPEHGYVDQWGRPTDTGDLALDVDTNAGSGEYGYEYGIKTSGPNKGQVCYLPDWSLPHASQGLPANAPSTMSCDGPDSEIVGYVPLMYVNAGEDDHGFSNWVIETKVPKRYLGSPALGENGNLHTALTCGNDVIEIGEYTYDYPAPEFTSAIIPLLILIAAPLTAYVKARG